MVVFPASYVSLQEGKSFLVLDTLDSLDQTDFFFTDKKNDSHRLEEDCHLRKKRKE